VLRWLFGIEAVELADADRTRLAALQGQRALITPNHPSLAEPVVVFQALAQAGFSALFLTGWEAMTSYGGLSAAVLQRVGAYSVLRGRRDRASMQATQQLLLDGKQVVVFAEGETYGLNDTLLPFQQGVAQLGFWALEEMGKQGIDGPLYLAPLAVKYVYTRPMEREIEASLRRLEARLRLPEGPGGPYARLSEVAAAVLAALEREFGVNPPADATLDQRIAPVRDLMIRRVATLLRVELPANASFPAQVRALFNAYHDFLSGEGAAPQSEYERALHAQDVDAARALYPIWARLKNFLAVRNGYIQQLPSQERFLDILGRLEIEVIGRSRIRGPRRALIGVGEPLDLRPELPAYRAARRETVARVTRELEERVMAQLRRLMERTEPAPDLAGPVRDSERESAAES
jgi:hypothetical protein